MIIFKELIETTLEKTKISHTSSKNIEQAQIHL